MRHNDSEVFFKYTNLGNLKTEKKISFIHIYQFFVLKDSRFQVFLRFYFSQLYISYLRIFLQTLQLTYLACADNDVVVFCKCAFHPVTKYLFFKKGGNHVCDCIFNKN